MNELPTNNDISNSRVKLEESQIAERFPDRSEIYKILIWEARSLNIGETGRPEEVTNSYKSGLITTLTNMPDTEFDKLSGEVIARKEERLKGEETPRSPEERYGLTDEQVKKMRADWDRYVNYYGFPPMGGGPRD